MSSGVNIMSSENEEEAFRKAARSSSRISSPRPGHLIGKHRIKAPITITITLILFRALYAVFLTWTTVSPDQNLHAFALIDND